MKDSCVLEMMSVGAPIIISCKIARLARLLAASRIGKRDIGAGDAKDG